MTDVLVRLTAPSSGAAASGWVPADEVAAVGHLECRPYAPDVDGARLHLEAPDRLLLPASMPPVRLVAGEAVLHLAATGVGRCWQVIERTPRGKTRYVLVPDSAATLDYADLVDVDPLTLDPAAEPEAAWWAALEAALHSHSNKTALDAVSGTNTGDQDLASLGAAPASGQFAVNTVAASGAAETLPATHAAHRVTMDEDCTLSFTSPTAGHAFVLLLLGAFTPTWPASVDWAGGAAPTYASGTLYHFATLDGGTTWLGSGQAYS